MPNPTDHAADFQLVQRCLDHDSEALAYVRKRFGPMLVGYLTNRGISRNEAVEDVESLWADCLSPNEAGVPRFRRYDGDSALFTWLCAVALNGALMRKRAESRREKRVASGLGDNVPDAPFEESETEAALLELMRAAIEFAFRKCPAQDFVLLQLKHCHRLHGEELAKMFDSNTSSIFRSIDAAETGVASATLAFVRSKDPWLELEWNDFLELCRTCTLSCFAPPDEG